MAATREGIDYSALFEPRPHPERPATDHEQQKKVGDLKQWTQESYQYRLNWERQWDLNRLFLKGDQLVGKHRITGDIIRLNTEDSKRLRSQNNMLRPTSRSLVGKLAKLIPTYTCVPATADFEEAHGCRAADLVLQYLRANLDLDRTYHDMCSYLPWAGNAFLQLCWNPLAGRTIGFCENCNFFSYDEHMIGGDCPYCLQQWQESQIQMKMTQLQDQQAGVPVTPLPGPPSIDGAPPPGTIPQLVEAQEGDVEAIVRDPRDVFLPPGALDVRSIRRFAVRETMEVSEACRRYPMVAQFLKPDSGTDLQSGTTAHRFSTADTTGTMDDLKDHLYVYEFHEAPTEQYPDGRVIVMINDLLVEEKPGYYKKLGRLPLYQFGFDPVEGEIYREAYITQAWHRQRELNRLETQMREHIEQVLHPKLMNPIGSRISNEEFEADSAQVINYNPSAGEVEWVNPPPLPQGIWERKQDLMQDIRVQASITESEQGINTADPNGRAMAIINAESDQQVGPIVHRNNSEWKAFYRGTLILYRSYAHPERLASVAGPQGTQTVFLKDLHLLNPGWDLKMEQEDGLSRNPAVRLTQAMDLAQIGYFMDPMTGMLDKKSFAQYAKLQEPSNGYDTMATEKACAASIPGLVMQGVPWQPHLYDDPMIFEEELRAWLRGPGRKIDPMVAMQVEQIWMYYAQWAMTGMMGQPPPQGPAPAGSPNPGPSQPGSGQSAPGGTVSAPGRLGSTIAARANTQVQQADAQGEGAARTQMNHEN